MKGVLFNTFILSQNENQLVIWTPEYVIQQSLEQVILQ